MEKVDIRKDEAYNSFMKSLDLTFEDICNLSERYATATQTPPTCTEILPEEALRYIDAIRKAAYEQGYHEGYERGVEETKSEIRDKLNL